MSEGYPQRLHRAGKGPMDVTLRPELDAAFKLVFVRCHFREAAGTADLVLSLDSAAGEEFDARLYSYAGRGLDADVHLIISAAERADPSPWSFAAGDGLRFRWPGPAGAAWGLELGYQEL